MIGWFSGEFGQINPLEEAVNIHRMNFEGGDDQDWYLDELKSMILRPERRLPTLVTGQFANFQGGGGVFSRRVVNIMQTNKWRCKFYEDNEKMEPMLQHMERISTFHVEADIGLNDNISDRSSHYEESSNQYGYEDEESVAVDEHNENGNDNIHGVLVQVEGDTAKMEDSNDSEEY